MAKAFHMCISPTAVDPTQYKRKRFYYKMTTMSETSSMRGLYRKPMVELGTTKLHNYITIGRHAIAQE